MVVNDEFCLIHGHELMSDSECIGCETYASTEGTGSIQPAVVPFTCGRCGYTSLHSEWHCGQPTSAGQENLEALDI